jgi:hypothetical protein
MDINYVYKVCGCMHGYRIAMQLVDPEPDFQLAELFWEAWGILT